MPKGMKGFQKGILNPSIYQGPPNKGRPNSEETRKKIKARIEDAHRRGLKFGFQKGHKSFKGCEKTQFKKGQIPWNKNKKCPQISASNKGKIIPEKTRKKIANSLFGLMSGSKHCNWQDGKSFELYGLNFNKQFKRYIKKRDNYTCLNCRNKNKLIIHHIDENKQNNDEFNLVTLCRSCHIKYHNGGKKMNINFFGTIFGNTGFQKDLR